MLMKTFKTNEEALKNEVWELIDHVQTMGFITFDKAASLWSDQREGMEFTNPDMSLCEICCNETKQQPCFKCL